MFEGRTLNLELGIPSKKVVKPEDPYKGRAVLIIKAAPEAKKQTFKFQLTEEAIKLLQLEKIDGDDVKTVSFSFVSENEIYVVNSTMIDNVDAKHKYQVSMNGVFSNKDAHAYITNLLSLDPSMDFEMGLHEVINNAPTMKLVMYPGASQGDTTTESQENVQ